MHGFRLDGHRLEIKVEPLIAELPRFLIGSSVVVVGPYLDRAQHEQFVLETAGSVDWFSTVEVDEFRFDVSSGLLKGVALRVPEHMKDADECVANWINAEQLQATPRLIDIANFQVMPAAYRAFDKGALVCLREKSDAGSEDFVQINIAPTLSLLTVGGDYVGWRLEAAASVLAESDMHSPYRERDDELSRRLGEYLELTSFPYLDRIFEGDQRVREKLEEISRRLGNIGDRQNRAVLISQIDRLIGDWY